MRCEESAFGLSKRESLSTQKGAQVDAVSATVDPTFRRTNKPQEAALRDAPAHCGCQTNKFSV